MSISIHRDIWSVSYRYRKYQIEAPLVSRADGGEIKTIENGKLVNLCGCNLKARMGFTVASGGPAYVPSASGGLAHRETGRFPGGPLLQEFFRAPGRTREFISLIISWHSRQTGSAFTEPVERPPYLPVGGPHVCSGASCYLCEKLV